MKASRALAVASAALFSVGSAAAADFGSTGLRGGGSETMSLSPSAHAERICNGYFSAGKIVARINGGTPKNIPAGACVETYAQSMTIQNPGDGTARVFFGRAGKQNI